MSDSDRIPVHRALISVYDKAGLDDLVRGLHQAGAEIVSTGSTAKRIAALGIPVTPVEQLTGFPECLDGRVKTLHPKVHAGLLADLRLAAHQHQLDQLGIEPFQLVVANLYPFRDTVMSGAAPEECIEQIDIGGPAMVRAAAKNHPSVAVVVDPGRYSEVLDAVQAGGFTLKQRQYLAADAFRHTAGYDVAVASYLGSVVAPPQDGSNFPAWAGATWDRAAVLRYGENPHQRAALYTHWRPGLAHAEQLNGKEMSYNNYVDTDAAWRAAHDHRQPAVAIIKHNNPCGIALGAGPDPIADAHLKAHACDPVSAYGGVIASNGTVTQAVAENLSGIFTEVIAAPGYEPAALELLRQKKNIRVLRVAGGPNAEPIEFRPISGGLLMQEIDQADAVTGDGGDDAARWTLVAGDAADDATLADLQFAWRAVRAVKSNAILLARGGASVGIGMGQVNRVDSCRLAVERANAAPAGGAGRAKGAVAASDAFFPFPDGLQILISAGVRAVVHPGGSIRDDEVNEVARAAGITMYTTGVRHFAH